MSLVVKKRNVNSLPSLVNDFFNLDTFLGPRMFDFENKLLNIDSSSIVPEANIIEKEKDFEIELAAPGLERKDFKVEVKGGILSISAEKKEEKSEDTANFRRREFSYNSFSRSFTLPENSQSDNVDAKYENGIHRISIPKKETTISKPGREIKVS